MSNLPSRLSSRPSCHLFAPSYPQSNGWLPRGSSVAWGSWPLPHPNLAQVALDAKWYNKRLHPLEKNRLWKDIENMKHMKQHVVSCMRLYECIIWICQECWEEKIPWQNNRKTYKKTQVSCILPMVFMYSTHLSFVPSPLAATWDHDFIRIMASMKSCTCDVVKQRSAGKLQRFQGFSTSTWWSWWISTCSQWITSHNCHHDCIWLRTPKIPNTWTSESCKMQRFNVQLVSPWMPWPSRCWSNLASMGGFGAGGSHISKNSWVASIVATKD